MRSSIWLLTATTCLAGGAAVGLAQSPVPYSPPSAYATGGYLQPVPQSAPPGYVTSPANTSGYTMEGGAQPTHGLGLRQRLSNLFHPNRQTPTYSPNQVPGGVIYQSPEPQLAPPLATPPAKAPPQTPASSTRAPAQATSSPVTPVSAKTVQPAGEINQEYVQRVAIADDTSWIIGQLSYVHADGGVWVLRYAPLDKEDRYGGAVALARGVDMGQFQEGDLVYVQGQLVNEARASEHVGAPLYRVTSITLNERLDEPQDVFHGPAKQDKGQPAPAPKN
jgi:hypothetical protein